ncbi:MAG: adenine phosphoribosyltransferase [Candidatus Micrarchaeaceae archaeon]
MQNSEISALIKSRIREIRDYPKKGVLFRDLTPLFHDGKAFALSISELANRLPQGIDYVAGIESRGFIVGAAVAHQIGCGFVPIRKEGKLPYERIGREYELEYGTAKIEIHKDAVERGSSVAIIDDLLATGGTSRAACELVEELGASVSSLGFIVELSDLNGRRKLAGRQIISLVRY